MINSPFHLDTRQRAIACDPVVTLRRAVCTDVALIAALARGHNRSPGSPSRTTLCSRVARPRHGTARYPDRGRILSPPWSSLGRACHKSQRECSSRRYVCGTSPAAQQPPCFESAVSPLRPALHSDHRLQHRAFSAFSLSGFGTLC